MNRHMFLCWLLLALLFPVRFANAGDKAPEKPRIIEGVLQGDAPRDPVTKNPRQVHTVTLRGGQAYVITLEAQNKDLDPFLRIEDAAGADLGQDDDGGGGLNARLLLVPPKDGDYKVIATAYKGTGKYLLRVQESTEKLYTVGKDGLKIEGKINKNDAPLALLKGAPHKVFQVRLEAGQQHVFDLQSKEFDTFLIVQNAVGKVLAHDDDGGGGLNSRLEWKSPATACYRVIVASLDQKSGIFVLRVFTSKVQAEQSPEPGQKLTDAEQQEVERLRAEMNRHQTAGQFEEAMKVAKRIVDYRAQRQGAKHWEVFEAQLEVERFRRLSAVPVKDRAELARALTVAGEGRQLEQRQQYREAEEKHREALNLFRKVLGEEHTDTATNYSNVADCLLGQARHTEALALYQKALEIDRKVLGEKHSNTGNSYHNVAGCLYDQGLYAKALPLFQKSLDIYLQAAGEQHPGTASTYHNVANCFHRLGQYAEALPHCQKALQIYRKVSGEQHPNTAMSYHNVASCFQQLGRYANALPLYQRALDIRRQVLGDRHPATAMNYNNLASCFYSLGKYADALTLYQKVLDTHRQLFGDQHPDTISSYLTLAMSLDGQGKHAEALPQFQHALALCRQVVGEQHHLTAHCCNHLASCLSKQRQHAEALPLYQKALEIRQKVLGEQHPDTATSYNNVAYSLDSLGRYEESLPLHQKTLGIRQRMLGEQHPRTATSHSNLGSWLSDQGKHAQALPHFQKALEIKLKVLGPQHPDTALSYNHLASCLYRQGQYAEATRQWEKGLLGHEFGRLQAAASGFERAIFEADQVSPRAALATTLVRLKQSVQAWEHAESDLARGLLDDLPFTDGAAIDPEKLRQLSQVDQALVPLLIREKRTEAESQQLDSLTQERDRLLTELATIAAKQARDRVVPAARIQKQIPTQAAIVFWLDVDPLGRHLGCILRHEGPPIWVQLPSTDKVAGWTAADISLAERIVTALGDGTSDPATLQQLLTQLHRQRLAPLEPHLQGVRHLLVVPAGRMAKVPIEALTDRYTISYIPSASIFARAMEQHRVLEASSLLVLADPTFQSAGTTPPPSPRHGLFIAAVLPGSLAAKVGLRAGDVLQEYGDALLLRPDDLQPTVGADRIPIKLWREGRELQGRIPAGKLGVVLDKRPVGIAVAHWRSEQLERAVRSKDWQSLPGTRLEARTLAALLPQTTTLLGSEASEQRLNQLVSAGKLKEFRLLHLATHGEANDTLPRETALILAQDKLPTPDEAAKLVLAGQTPPQGRLTVGHVLSQWNLDADLVVLSACQTGLGKHTDRDGMLGFTQALLQKGARSVVLSRWKVDDAATALLMARFYENLLGKREGLKEALPRAEALREATTWLRQLSRAEAEKHLAALVDGLPRGERGTIRPALPTRQPEAPQAEDRPFAHPYYWAAFILVGDPK